MRAPVYKGHASLEFNMTPMIDVTFLLIIFFLLASHFAQQEVQLDLDLPSAASGQPIKESQARRITINVLADGQALLGGQRLAGPELSRRIEFESRQLASPGEELEVRIRTDRSAPYRDVEPILLACARAGIWKVSFSVVRDKQ
ncbi:MAG TPA: biopolymer transporter ExbD [Pirellulales bacterium]|jgi:biopolymer transport protein ExbD|nr:biopolymer transporter ExbD [Pirellulales bacterium]